MEFDNLENTMALSQYTLLIVDDNTVSRELTSRYLGKKGYNISTAKNGDEALAINDIERFDLILLDVYMPDLDGIEVLKKLKKKLHTKNIPIVIYTSSTESSHKRMANELDVDDYLLKSDSLSSVRDRILKVLKNRRIFGQEEPEQKLVTPIEDIRLLVVDDDEMSRNLLENRITKLGYENIDTADSGNQAYELMKSHDYDLVFLDVIMPDLDGIGLLKKIRSDEELESTSVIMVSSSSDQDIISKCKDLGASNYVIKPFHYSLIKNAIDANISH